MPLRIEIAETLESVDALAGEWAALEAQTPEATGFQSYAWCRAWLQAVGVTRGCRPRVVTVWDDRRLVMLWPLQIEAAFGATIVRWIGEPMTQYGDALAGPGDDRAYWRDAVDAEFSRWNDVDLFAFTRLRADGVVAATTTASLNGDGFMAAPFVDLEFPVKPARRHRKRFERRARLLATFGPVRFAEVIDPAERARLARSAIAIKLGWLRRQGLFSATLLDQRVVDFIVGLARDGHLRVHGLWVGERVAAIDLGFGNRTYRSLLGCFDLEFAAGSPGHALTASLIAQLRQEGAERLDLLWPSDAYKLDIASGTIPIGSHLVAVSLRGQLASLVLLYGRPMAKRVLGLISAIRHRRAVSRSLARPKVTATAQ